jgi:predicted MFS family arabinose efflux permease
VTLFGRLFRLVWGADVDRPLRPVLAVSLVSSIANSTVWTFVGIWAIKDLGAGESTLGAAFLVSALVGAVSGYAGGHLSDHVGRKPLIMVGWACQTLLVLGFLAAGGRTYVGLGLICLSGLFFQIGNAANNAMIADLVPGERHEAAYASVRVASNLGVTVGPPLGGLLIALGSWAALFAGTAGVSAAGLLLAIRFLPRRGGFAAAGPPARKSSSVIVRDRAFLLFLVSSALAWLVYVSFEVVLPISLVESHGLRASTWGFLVVVNPIMVTAFQLRLTRRLEPISAAVKLGIGLPLMGVPFLLLPVLDPLPVIAALIFVFVIGEMLWVPSSQKIVAGLAPQDLRGAYMGAFGSTAALGFALAPFLGLQIRHAWGDGAVWVAMASVSLVAGATGAIACRFATRRSAPAGADPAAAAA